jgi:hypothetical protein
MSIQLQELCETIPYSYIQGSDFTNVYIRSTENPLTDAKNDLRLSDELRFVKFSSIAWTHNSKGFFYQVRALAPGPIYTLELLSEISRPLFT